jgi:hypothetical protein
LLENIKQKAAGIVTKICTKCKEEKNLDQFKNRRGNQKHLLHSWCKSCEYQAAQDWRKENPEKIKVYRAKDKWTLHKRTRRMGITVDEFWTMYENQKGKCPICLQNIEAEDSAIDHNHTTGLVRGILCKSCNRGIGLLKDSSAVLNRASNYLLEKGEK